METNVGRGSFSSVPDRMSLFSASPSTELYQIRYRFFTRWKRKWLLAHRLCCRHICWACGMCNSSNDISATHNKPQVSKSLYQDRLNKLKLVIKSSLIGLIHDHTMQLPSLAYDNGDATTLVATDIDGLDMVAEMVHETWAQVLEVMIGMAMLASQVGWIWPILIFLIYSKPSSDASLREADNA